MVARAALVVDFRGVTRGDRSRRTSSGSRWSRLAAACGPRAPARRADRLTLGLAAAAVGTAGAVIGGELAAADAPPRERAPRSRDAPCSVAPSRRSGGRPGDPGHAAVAVEGYDATPRGETVLFNMFTGFVGAFA